MNAALPRRLANAHLECSAQFSAQVKDGCRCAGRGMRMERLEKHGHAAVGNRGGLQVCDRQTEEEKRGRQTDREPQRQLDSCPLRDIFFFLWPLFKFFSFSCPSCWPPTPPPFPHLLYFSSVMSDVLSTSIICLPGCSCPPSSFLFL